MHTIHDIITTLNLGHMPPRRLSVALPLALIFFSSLHAPAASSCSSDAKATGNDALAAGQALGTSDKLVSANGKFALGFFQFQQSLSTSSTICKSPGWYLGIWFNKIPVCTAVWVANRERPVTESELKATRLKVSRGGHLVIFIASNTSTESIVVGRSTKVVNSANSTCVVVLKNTGNLVATIIIPAKPHSRKEVLLWQSFDHPTDVSLPTSKVGRNKVTGSNVSLVAKKSLIDPSPGSYCVEIDTNGVLQLRTCTPPFVVDWSWAPGKLGKLVQSINGLIESDPRTKGLLVTTYQDNYEEVYISYNLRDESVSVFVSIDIYSAQLLLNIWSQATESWLIIFTQPSNFCYTYSACGPFTVCDGNLSPLLCGCMEGFYQKSPQDWDLGDRTGGCARATPLDCINGNTNKTNSTDVFRSIAQVTLPYDSQLIGDAATQSDCAHACLNDCSCTAYSYSSSKCSIWHGELLNVVLDDGILISPQVLYIRLAASDFQSLTKKGKRPPRVIIATSIVVSGLIVLVLLLMIWRNRFKWCNVLLHGIQGSGGIIAFRYTDLCHATKNFSERLGGGGFGSVFKGVLSDSTTIAVKRLDGARQGEKQFRAEVSTIGMIQHINLVKLIGFCCGGDNRLLVYEHMVNGSLDAHLFQSNATVLNWNTRYQIALGVARGLCYLHESCRECIIHCDIKPENILLDASFVPKIADFGMAAFVGRDFSRVLTTFRGTAGYLAPEWLSGVAITPKVDVYSFGMVLLEIVSGKRNTPEVHSKSSYHVAYFPVQAISKLHERDLQSLVDPQLEGDIHLEEAERICKVALWCIQDNECDRPTMAEVVRVLEGLQELHMPPMPRLLAAITEHSDAVLV